MFYSIRIGLLTFLASVSGLYAQDTLKEQVFSFLKGAGSVTLGMGVGYGVSYITGRPVKQQYVATAVGALGGAAFDHYCWGGKEDKNQIARKSGNFVPMIFVGGMLYYNNKKIMVRNTAPKINRDGSVSQVPVADDVYVKNDPDMLKALATPQRNPVAAASSSSSPNYVPFALRLDESDTIVYENLKGAAFLKNGPEFIESFNSKYSTPTANAVRELALSITAYSDWQETCPPRGTVQVGSQTVDLGAGEIATIISGYRN